MNYNYVVLEDGTQIAHSNILDDGSVKVVAERPVELGFDSAQCMLPSFEWSHVEGFSPADMKRLDRFVHANAPLILRYAREASKIYA